MLRSWVTRRASSPEIVKARQHMEADERGLAEARGALVQAREELPSAVHSLVTAE